VAVKIGLYTSDADLITVNGRNPYDQNAPNAGDVASSLACRWIGTEKWLGAYHAHYSKHAHHCFWTVRCAMLYRDKWETNNEGA
jgi:hypothetical protein